MPAQTVIILNWNGRDFLPTCLSSLERQTFRGFETLLVDNGSTDGSIALVRERFPWVRVLALDQNYGFCGGNNRGMAEANGDNIVLLNNDTECHPDFLRALIDAIERRPDVGMCASRMLDFSDRTRVDNCGIGLTLFGTGYPIGSGKMNDKQFDQARQVFGACAGAALYRRGLFDVIGAFDEDLGSHIEDTDLSWRAQLAGYRCLYVPGAIAYHRGGATARRMKQETLYRIQRNQTWAYLKNMPTCLLIGLFPLHLAYSFYWLMRASRQGEGGIVWKAKRDAFAGWDSIMAKRRLVQAKRRLSTIALLGKIDWRRI